MPESTKLVTLNGECFEAVFVEARSTLPDRDGTLHYFRLHDLVKGRGERLVSLYFFNFDRLSIPQFEFRLSTARLNALRRAFDSEALSFDSLYNAQTYREVPLAVSEFGSRPSVGDAEIRQYIFHKAYLGIPDDRDH